VAFSRRTPYIPIMARMIAELYDALRSAGADEEKARAAATAMAGPFESERRFDRLEGQLAQIDGRMDQLEGRMDRLEGRMDRLEARMDRLESRVGKLETDVTLLKWMVGFLIALVLGVFFVQWQILLRLPPLG
jgi:predicted nuclease with TOPRIM domain